MVFISWLNIDLGIETCFYDGLTFYQYSWLQLILVPILHLVSHLLDHSRSHCSLTVAKYLGNFNPVAVLATLLLMSYYGKILQAIITSLSSSYLTHMYTDSVEYHRAIWLYNGNNINYRLLHRFSSHCTSSCICHPYATLSISAVLLFGHYLQAWSHWIMWSVFLMDQ